MNEVVDYQERIERLEEKVEAVTSSLERWKHVLSENEAWRSEVCYAYAPANRRPSVMTRL